MDIIKFYREVLRGLSCTADREGFISFQEPGGVAKPITIDKRRLVLPIKKRLDDGITEELIAFHPIGENLARKGPSPVLSKMQLIAKANLAFNITRLVGTLMEIAAKPSLHKDLTPECSEFLKNTTTADGKIVKVLDDLINKAITKNGLITVYPKANGKLGGESYNRVCIIRLPIMEALRNEKEEAPYGVKLLKKHRKAILGLFDYLFPKGDVMETYSGGSNNQTAPFLDAFLQGYGNIATRINEHIKLFGDQINLNLDPIDVKFLKQLGKIDEFHRSIPVMEGNEGNLGRDEVPVETGTGTANAQQAALGLMERDPPWEEPARPETPQPARQSSRSARQETRSEESSQGLTMEELRRRRQAQNPQPPMQQPPMQQPYQQPPMQQPMQPQYQQPMQGGWNQPQMPYQQPMQPQYQQPAMGGWPQQQQPVMQGGWGHSPAAPGPAWVGGGQQQPQPNPQNSWFQQRY